MIEKITLRHFVFPSLHLSGNPSEEIASVPLQVAVLSVLFDLCFSNLQRDESDLLVNTHMFGPTTRMSLRGSGMPGASH